MVLPKDINLTAAYVLHFLSGHERHEAENFFDQEDIGHLSADLPATITLDIESKTFTVSVNLIGGATNKSVLTYERPGTILHNLTDVPGTIYTASHSPVLRGESDCWIQQYPGRLPGDVGRTVIEFYTNKIITAVFKTNNDNFGASGSGKWSIPGPPRA